MPVARKRNGAINPRVADLVNVEARGESRGRHPRLHPIDVRQKPPTEVKKKNLGLLKGS